MAKRNLDLSSRNENTREIISVKVFNIGEIKRHFQESLKDIENKFCLADELYQAGKIEEAKDIWRTQIVFLESAFDFFMHEIVKLGIVCMFNSEWRGNKTEKYKNLLFSMDYLERAMSEDEGDAWLKDWINEKYSSVTLMAYKDLKDICNLLELNIDSVANAFYEKNDTVPARDKLKKFINNLYKRRNKIAHQSDRRMEDAVKEEINESFVKNYFETMEKIVAAICTEVEQKSNSD